jgi:hypothetical protein
MNVKSEDFPPRSTATQQQMLLAYRDNAQAVPSGHVLCRTDEKSDGFIPWRQQPFWLTFWTPSISSIPSTVFQKVVLLLITPSNMIYRMW